MRIYSGAGTRACRVATHRDTIQIKTVFGLLLAANGILFSQQSPINLKQPLAAPSYSATDQKIVWVSGPAKPGDSVVLTGAFSPEPKTITIAPVSGGHTDWKSLISTSGVSVTPLYQGPESIMFTLPASLPASGSAYAFKLSDSAGTAIFGRINLPDVYWAMGVPSAAHLFDPGAQITPSATVKGELIRVFGRSFGPHPELVLKSMSGIWTVVPISSSSDWAITATVPLSVPDGSYDVMVRNEPGDNNTSSAAARITISTYRPGPVNVIDVQTCGASGDGVHDDSAAIQNCLNRAAGNSGSTIAHFKAGSYLLTRAISIPQHVYLKGSGRGQTILKIAGPIGKAPAFFSGAGYFGLGQMTIQAPSVPKVVGTTASPVGHILLDHLEIDGIDRNTAPSSLPDEATQLRLSAQLGRGDLDTLNLAGDDIRIVNSDIVSAGRALILSNAHGIYLANDSISDGPYGWYCISNSADAIFEHSRIGGVNDIASGGSYSATIGISENIYTDGNTYERMPAANGEAFTSDGPGGAYFGTLSTVSGAHLELAGQPNWKNRTWLGSSVAILAGRGAGQYRLIRNWNGATVDLEQPFEIAPDRTSVVTIVPTQRHYILVNNHVTDAGIGLQFYGTIFESVIANNTISRAAGIFLHAAKYGDGIQPNLFVQILNNTIARRGTFKGGPGNPNINDSGLVRVQCTLPSLSLGIVVRGNQLGSEAAVKVSNIGDSVHGLLIEKNAVQEPSQKVQVEHPSSRVVVREADQGR